MDRVNALQRTGQKQRQISGGDDNSRSPPDRKPSESPRRATCIAPGRRRGGSTWKPAPVQPAESAANGSPAPAADPAHNALSSQICWLVRLRACPGRSLAEINIPSPTPACSNGARDDAPYVPAPQQPAISVIALSAPATARGVIMVHGELTQASSARLAMVNPAEIMLSRWRPRLHPRQQQRTDQIASVIGRRGEIALVRVNDLH